MTPDRRAVLESIVRRIVDIAPGHPVRVAIEGPDAAGKSMFADELGACLVAAGRVVIRASADDFANPRAVRHRLGRRSPEGYFADAMDILNFRHRLLEPLGPDGDRQYCTRTWDAVKDAAVHQPTEMAALDAVLVVDGVFLGREELAGCWELRVLVWVPPEVSLARALQRDVPRLGTTREVEVLYRERYLPANERYLRVERAMETADVVVDNSDVDRPALITGPWSHPEDHVERETVAVASLRTESLPDPEGVGEDAELVTAIRAEIAEHGPIPFARFTERALYEPGHGFYRRAQAGPGMAGADFLTAPEAHPIFGAAVGRLVEEAWLAMGRPEPFVITEPGAGSGALAVGLLRGLRELGSPLFPAVRYRPVEVETARLAALRERLAADGFADHLEAGPADAPDDAGAVIANEVLDALPVHRVVGRGDGLRELLVTVDRDGRFAWLETEPTTPALAQRLAAEQVVLADGQVTEVCLALDGWLAETAARVRQGVIVLIDYAAEPADLHGPSHPTGTLRAFARHAVGADPFRHVGRQDLTATVDLAAVRLAAASAGMTLVGATTQAELLARAGTPDLTDAYLRRPGATLQDAFDLRSALARLMDPRGMGGFRVLVFATGIPGGLRLPMLSPVRPPG